MDAQVAMSPCKHGHTRGRNAWGQCLDCRRTYIRNRKVRKAMKELSTEEPSPRRPWASLYVPRKPGLTEEGHDPEPPPWDDDSGAQRVRIYDHNFSPPRLVRKVGWVNCLGYGERHRFLSPDVAKVRLCAKCKAMQRYQDSTTIV
jgi:hypothetical protein